MKLDPAVVRTLSLPPSSQPSVSSHGGSGFASTSRITTTNASGAQQSFFLKTSSAKDAATMFEGEHASLNAISGIVPSLSPRSLGWGELEKGGYFLVTEFLNLGGVGSRSRGEKAGSGLSLAQKLANLHTTPAPTSVDHDNPMFGFSVPTCCGDTVQLNRWKSSWAEFYAEERLLMILTKAESSNGRDKALRDTVEQVAQNVVPRLLGDGYLGGENGIRPVVVHGDLWSGNKGRGIIDREAEDGDAGGWEEVIFDPSACYAHGEFELGIMKMFGGFGGTFLKEYHQHCPKTEPVDEYEDRVELYELYHHLNHYAIFGGGYKGGAVSIMKRLLSKYGEGRQE